MIATLAGISSAFSWGMVVAFPGSVKLQLASRIQADNAQFGQIVATFQWLMVGMAIISGIAVDRLGYRPIIVAGALLCVLAIFQVGRERRIGGVMAMCGLLSMGGQFLNVGSTTLISILFADPAVGNNLKAACFGMGALLVSIITAHLFQKVAFGRALSIVAALTLLPMIFVFGGGFPTPERTFSLEVAGRLLGNPATWVAIPILFCYMGLEASLAAWLTSFATELGADEVQASRLLSIFLVAIMLGRLVWGLQNQVTGIDLTSIGRYVLTGGALVVVIAITILIHAQGLGVARGAGFLAGFAFGPILPTTLGLTVQHFAPAVWGTLFGMLFAVGFIGAGALPVRIGHLAQDKSVRAGFRVLRGAAVALCGIAFVFGTWPPA
jgi:fucose permease